jgi:lipoprotein Spr
MLIPKFTKTALPFLLASSLFWVSCTNSRSITEQLAYSEPKFIDSIMLDNPNSSSITLSVKKKNTAPTPSLASVASGISGFLQEKYASLMGIVPNLITNYSLYSFIDEWYGVRYRFGGNNKNGIDCSAFVQRMYEQVFNMNLVRTAIEQFSECKMVFDKEALKEGDLVFFCTKGNKRISHVGVYLANNYFIHASSTLGVAISSLNETYWHKHLAGYGQVPHAKNYTANTTAKQQF